MTGTSETPTPMTDEQSREIVAMMLGEARMTYLYDGDGKPSVEMYGEFNERELEAALLAIRRMKPREA